MTRILILAGALLAVTLLRNVLPFLIARLFGRAIGSHALAQQPDEIHLENRGPNAWQDPSAVRPLASPLLGSRSHAAIRTAATSRTPARARPAWRSGPIIR
jgi:hypothetical protein